MLAGEREADLLKITENCRILLNARSGHYSGRHFLAINRQPLDLQSCSNHPRIQKTFG